MPSAKAAELRVYCICGQKMKVSTAMFGRPGKCVACSQKIRIPTPEELPSGLTDVYLKDHPEFLRKTLRATEEAAAGEDVEDASLGDELEQSAIAPLDTLETVQRLCSYDYLVSAALERYRGAEPGSPEATEKTQLMGYRALARKARSELDERLRRRLMEVAVELSDVKEKIARAGMSARVGEIDMAAFMETVAPLRRRRETLERLRHNLRGWVTVSNPYLAGGLLDLPLEDPPVDVAETAIPETVYRDDQALLDQVLRQMREALEEREYAERKLAEWERVQKEGGLTGYNIERYKEAAQAARTRSRGAVVYCRDRVQQVLQDAEAEVKAVRAHLELARHRLEAGELNASEFNTIELDLLRAQADSAKACDLARLTLRAKTIDEIPRVQTNLFRRLARRDSGAGIGLDSWLAWAAALAMVLAIFVPMVDPVAGGNAIALRGLILSLVVIAAALALAASIPSRRTRGLLIGLLWLAASAGFTLYLYGKYHGIERVGEIMRRDPYWVAQPGMLILIGSGILAAFSFFTALLQERGLRHIPFILLAAGLLIGGAAVSDLAGYLKPQPIIAAIDHKLENPDAAARQAAYRVDVTFANSGRRTYWLNPKGPANPEPVTFRVGRKVAEHDWNYEAQPVRIQKADSDWRELQGMPPEESVRPGDNVTYQYLLAPGVYRIELNPAWRREGLYREFTLAAPRQPAAENAAPPLPAVAAPATPAPPVPAPEPAPATPPQAEPETETGESPPAPEVPAPVSTFGPELELRGVGGDPKSHPRFVITIHHPDGQTADMRVGLGDPIYKSWAATEYDPERASLTVGLHDEDGKVRDLRILHTGERIALPLRE